MRPLKRSISGTGGLAGKPRAESALLGASLAQTLEQLGEGRLLCRGQCQQALGRDTPPEETGVADRPLAGGGEPNDDHATVRRARPALDEAGGFEAVDEVRPGGSGDAELLAEPADRHLAKAGKGADRVKVRDRDPVANRQLALERLGEGNGAQVRPEDASCLRGRRSHRHAVL